MKATDELNDLQHQHDALFIPKWELQEMLEWYLAQLQKRGATLEDCICGVLRKMILQCDLRQRIDAKKVELARTTLAQKEHEQVAHITRDALNHTTI